MLDALGKLWAAFGIFFTAFEAFAQILLSLANGGKGMAQGWEEKEALMRIKERRELERNIAADEAEQIAQLAIAAPGGKRK